MTVSWTPPSSPPCNVSRYDITFNSIQEGCTCNDRTDSTMFHFTPPQNCHISQYGLVTVTAVDDINRLADTDSSADLSGMVWIITLPVYSIFITLSLEFLESSCLATFCSDNCSITYLYQGEEQVLDFELNVSEYNHCRNKIVHFLIIIIVSCWQ